MLREPPEYTEAQERIMNDAQMDMDTLDTLKKSVAELISEAASLLNNPIDYEPSHFRVECVLEAIDDAFNKTCSYNEKILDGCFDDVWMGVDEDE